MSDDGWLYSVRDVAGNYSQEGSDAYWSLIVSLYCVNPPEDDHCLIGICPNPDIAGTLLRIARKFSLSFPPRMVI